MNRRTRILLDTLLPSNTHPQLQMGLIESGFEDWERGFKRDAVFTLVLGYRLACFTCLWIVPLLAWRIPPLTLYSRAKRERLLEAMERSRIKLMRDQMLVLKTVICLHYGAVPQVRRAMNHPRPDGEIPGRPDEQALPPSPRLGVLYEER